MALDTIKRSSLSLSRSLDDVLKHREREKEERDHEKSVHEVYGM